MSADEGKNGSSGRFFKDYSWQERAIVALMAGISDFYNAERGKFCHAFVVEVSPSGGKTKFSLKSARELIQAGLIDKVFYVVPRETIKDGFKRDCEDIEMAEPFRLGGSKLIRIEEDLKTNYVGQLRNYHGAVINYQSLDRFLSYFRLLSDAGRRLLFVFDEIHHGKMGEDDGNDACANEWGKAMTEVRQLAHAIIGMSGTPVRADEDPVPYLRYELVDQFNPRSGQVSRAYYVKPDFKFTYKMAIEVGVARKLIFRPQDPIVAFRYAKEEGAETEEFNGPLSGVPRFLVDRAKRELFDPKRGHIDDMLKVADEENKLDRKIGDAEAAILVVVGPTAPDGYNPLEHVADRIKVLFSETAATVESKDGPQARDVVNRFRENNLRWLVSKDMVSEGTSIPRVRTVLILRDIKSPVRFEQIVHRATRNRSDEFAQDAKVVLFHLPDMIAFVGTIEEEIRLVVPTPRPMCPVCGQKLEYRPRRGKPCVQCGYEPEPKEGGGSSTMEFEWLFSEFGEEIVLQGGDDYSRYDPLSRRILGKLGQNPHYGGRHGINEIFRAADEDHLISLNDAKPETPYTDEEMMDKYWEGGRKLCEKAAGAIARAQKTDYQDAVRKIIAECKRAAGMGREKQENIRRDHKDAIGAFRKFYEAAQRAHERATKRYGA